MRIISLFAFGVALALVLNFLQKQKNVTVFSPGVFGDVLNSAWWMPPAFGFGASVYLTSDNLKIHFLKPFEFTNQLFEQESQYSISWIGIIDFQVRNGLYVLCRIER